GHDFSHVRVHTDERAADSAQSVNALAYTVGQHIVFTRGQFAPHSEAGQRLLAHELTHTIQQGDVAASSELRLGADADASERTADEMATHVVGAGAPAHVGASPRVSAPLVQRQPADKKPEAAPAAAAEDERLIASFDVEGKRHWQLDQLTKEIVTALSANERAYVRIFGVYPTKANEDDPKQKA